MKMQGCGSYLVRAAALNEWFAPAGRLRCMSIRKVPVVRVMETACLKRKSPPGSETGRAGVICRLGSLYTITPPVPSADDEFVEDVDCDWVKVVMAVFEVLKLGIETRVVNSRFAK